MNDLATVQEYSRILDRMEAIRLAGQAVAKEYNEIQLAMRRLLAKHEAISYGMDVYFLDDDGDITVLKTVSVFTLGMAQPTVVIEQEDDGEVEPPVTVPVVPETSMCFDRPDSWHDDDMDEHYDEEARRDDEHRIWEGLRA